MTFVGTRLGGARGKLYSSSLLDAGLEVWYGIVSISGGAIIGMITSAALNHSPQRCYTLGFLGQDLDGFVEAFASPGKGGWSQLGVDNCCVCQFYVSR